MVKYTEELHARIRELSKNATPRPWYIEPVENMVVYGDEETGEEVGAIYYHAARSKKEKANRALLVEAPNAIEAILDEIERLNTALQTAKAEGFETGKKEAITSTIHILEQMHDYRDIAETAAPTPGETGRQKVIDEWEELLDDPATYISEKIAPIIIGHTYKEVMSQSADYIERQRAEAWKDGYADCLCDIEAFYEIDSESIVHKTTNHYED